MIQSSTYPDSTSRRVLLGITATALFSASTSYHVQPHQQQRLGWKFMNSFTRLKHAATDQQGGRIVGNNPELNPSFSEAKTENHVGAANTDELGKPDAPGVGSETNEEDVASLVEYLVDSMKKGNIEELKRAGYNVRLKNDGKFDLEEKLQDEDILNELLGSAEDIADLARLDGDLHSDLARAKEVFSAMLVEVEGEEGIDKKRKGTATANIDATAFADDQDLAKLVEEMKVLAETKRQEISGFYERDDNDEGSYGGIEDGLPADLLSSTFGSACDENENENEDPSEVWGDEYEEGDEGVVGAEGGLFLGEGENPGSEHILSPVSLESMMAPPISGSPGSVLEVEEPIDEDEIKEDTAEGSAGEMQAGRGRVEGLEVEDLDEVLESIVGTSSPLPPSSSSSSSSSVSYTTEPAATGTTLLSYEGSDIEAVPVKEAEERREVEHEEQSKVVQNELMEVEGEVESSPALQAKFAQLLKVTIDDAEAKQKQRLLAEENARKQKILSKYDKKINAAAEAVGIFGTEEEGALRRNQEEVQLSQDELTALLSADADNDDESAVFGDDTLRRGEGGSSSSSSGGSEIVSSTLNAVKSSDFAALDIRSLLGEALYTVSESMGIDVAQELANSTDAKLELQNIMQNSVFDLAMNMKELDEQSEKLYQRLELLKEELQQETMEFEEKKMGELDIILDQQAVMGSEFSRSQRNLQQSTERLANVVRDITEDADAITALALFPLRSKDQKAAFIVGLALLFKVPFDASHLIALRSDEISQWVNLGLQALVSLACFNHYGLVKAVFKSFGKR